MGAAVRRASPRIALLAFASVVATAAASGSVAEGGMALARSAPLSQPAGAARLAKVDTRVLEDTSGGRIGRFLVVLGPQVDVDALAERTDDWRSRGRTVVAALRRTATNSQKPVRTALRELGVSFRSYWIANVIAVEGSRAVVEKLAARAGVRVIEPDRPVRGTTALDGRAAPRVAQAVDWNVEKIGAPRVWSLGYSGQGVVYANADSGVLWEHPAVKPQYRGWDGSAASHDYNWWDAVHEDIDGDGGSACGFSSRVPCDDVESAHGTATMSVAIGDDQAGNQVGVAPGARWIACRNMDAGVGRPSTYIECLQFFLAPTNLDGGSPNPDRRPHVIGNSYGCPEFEGCTVWSLQVAVQSLRAAGVFFAAGAGNDGPECSTIVYPPGLDDAAVTVGATDANDSIAPFSSRGPVTADGSGRLKPDLVAPGVNVRVAARDGGYAIRSGTSFATPHLSGAVAVLWSAFPSLRGNVDRTEQILETTAVQLTSPAGCGGVSPTAVPNHAYGFGRIDLLAAYAAAETEYPPSLEVTDVSLVEGSSGATAATFAVTLSRASTRTVTVRFATADRTATAPGDYTAASGALSFAPGETKKTVTVGVVGDKRSERDETFLLRLSEPVSATLARNEAVATVKNDDADTTPPIASSLSVRPERRGSLQDPSCASSSRRRRW